MPDFRSIGPFEKLDAVNPILTPRADAVFDCPLAGRVKWEEKDVFNPAAVVRGGRVFLLYRAEDRVGRYHGTSRIGLASSDDGLHFTRLDHPVIAPGEDFMRDFEWEGGCEDPRAVEDDAGTYYCYYTAFDGTLARLCVATSTDLLNWTKRGLAFSGISSDGGAGGASAASVRSKSAEAGSSSSAEAGPERVRPAEDPFYDLWSKSGSVVVRADGERMLATRINGKYWMYWGESNIYAATSDDLIRWTPVRAELEAGQHFENPKDGLRRHVRHRGALALAPVLRPRSGRFDSVLVEPGPPALLSDAGVLLLYNARNSQQTGEAALPEGTYALGQALFDPIDPTACIARSITHCFIPERDYELTGQINNVCFVEGLVRFRGRWLMYYGTADSQIAVATAPLV